MTTRHALSYVGRGILFLDEWEVAEDDHEERFVRKGSRSTALGHINNPRTGFKVPGHLAASYDALVEQWAIGVATGSSREIEP